MTLCTDRPASRRDEQTIPRMRLGSLLVITLVSVATLIFLTWAFDADLVDDSYIFLRYAWNIAEGHGAVFNIGERVEGYSSPLWTFMLGAAGLAFKDLETLAFVLSLCCGGAVIALLLWALNNGATTRARAESSSAAHTTGGIGVWEAVVLGIGLASSPVVVFWSGSGMDAPLFLLLITASLLSILKDRDTNALSIRTVVLLTLATFTRSEGVIIAAYAGAFFLWERRSIRMLLWYAVAIVAMLLVRHQYYGAWVPNTYHAKVTFDLMRRLTDGATYIGLVLRTNGLLLLMLAVVLLIAWRRRTLARVPILFLGGWIALWCSYVLYVGGDNFAAFRFLLPTLPAWFLLIAWGWMSVRDQLPPVARLSCMAGLLVAFSISHVSTYRSQAPHYLGDVKLARSWSKVGRWLKLNTAPDNVIATIVPGALGYHSHRPMIDMLGLTDRSVGLHGKVYPHAAHGHARYNTDYVFERDPDIVLYHSSGRFTEPVYMDPARIGLPWGYALFDFVTDPRCVERYAYVSARLDDGTMVEMLEKRVTTADSIARVDHLPR